MTLGPSLTRPCHCAPVTRPCWWASSLAKVSYGLRHSTGHGVRLWSLLISVVEGTCYALQLDRKSHGAPATFPLFLPFASYITYFVWSSWWSISIADVL